MRFLRRLAAAVIALPAVLPALAQSLVEQPMPPEQFAACVQGLAEQTATAGRPLRREDFLRIASAGRYDDRVRQSMLVRSDEPTFWWDELAATTDAERVLQGRGILEAHAAALQRIEARFGVPREIVVAVYGIETNYGPAAGRIPVLDAALTLACLRPCGDTASSACLSRERAYATVRLLRDARVPAENFVGSWAAAFGRTQFVPDTFEMIAVDGDGDGVIDIIQSEQDAWASTANHLQRRGGWRPEQPVYLEVAVPPDQQAQFAPSDTSVRLPAQAKPLSQWVAQGWRVLAASRPPALAAGDPEVYPFLPVGLPGPAFLVTRNFDTIRRYNFSDRYVMEVALLANKLAGGTDFVTPWPTDDPGLSRAEVRALQAWLQQRGHAQVSADGVMGRLTRDAIAAERAARGLPAGRRVGQRTLRELMQP
ncbi:lytic murein transglycosylase [Ramlibacter pallidus]|uniref:Lytic murein transglycosylase n=1 Tax=Ramlibacter pallidus TaxID=2780087 RepID=A0ABR9S6Y7_9BURK|nr:lytic murein transglycosylase [Ramlibacter pallidus]MBE7369294.1 lytic murein transglycosylase [Ramlibacter pallidus]